MNKMLGIVALVGGVTYSIVSGDYALANGNKLGAAPHTISEQSQDLQIKFGKDRKYTYKPSQEKYNPTRHIRESERRIGSVWGILYSDSRENKFDIWGVLNGDVLFHYNESGKWKALELRGPLREPKGVITFSDYLGLLNAKINDQTIQLMNSGKFSTYESEAKNKLAERLRKAYIEYLEMLNIKGVKQWVENVKKHEGSDMNEEIQETLDAILNAK